MRTIWFLCLLLGSVLRVTAAEKNIRFHHLSLEHGLSQVTVVDILQDRQGFLWFSTEDGLNRYDGYRIIAFRHSARDPGSISSNSVSCLREDRDGMIWVGTRTGDLNRFDSRQGTFRSFRHDPRDPNSLGRGEIQIVFEPSDPTSPYLWLGTRESGLIRFDKRSGECFLFRQDLSGGEGLGSDCVNAICEEAGSGGAALWIGHERGLDRLDLRTNRIRSFPLNPSGPVPQRPVPIKTILSSSRQVMWLGTAGEGLWRIDLASGRRRIFAKQEGQPGTLSDNYVNRLLEDARGDLWVGTEKGLNCYAPREDRFYSHAHRFDIPWSLSDNNVMALCEDRSGILWIGTWNSGVNWFDNKEAQFRNYFNVPGDANSLVTDNVRDVWLDRQGALWVGTIDGLDRIEADGKTFTHFRHDSRQKGSISDDFITDLYEDGQGEMWVGTLRGLNRFDRRTGRFVTFRGTAADPSSLSSNAIQRMIDDPSSPEHFLLVGTRDNGMNRFHKKTGRCQRFVHDPRDPTSVGGRRVYCFHVQRGGLIWLGTTSGLDSFDPSTQRFQHFRAEDNRLSHNNVIAIGGDPTGDPAILWVGTWGGGLNRVDVRNGTFRAFSRENGFPTNMISGILTDRRGVFWISSPNGIIQFQPATGLIHSYDVRVGEQSNAFSGGASFQSETGEVLFGGVLGVTRFDPLRLRTNPIRPPIVLTAYRVFDREVTHVTSLTGWTEIELPHWKRHFSLEFSALAFTNPEKNLYKYRLEGFDRNWVATRGANRTATYTNLDPGRYTFRVIGSNEDGVWNLTGLSLRIRVLPPFWRTTWFILLVAVSLIVLIGGGIQLRLRRHRQTERKLQSLVAERTGQLEKINRIVKTINSELDFNALLAAIIHEVSGFIGVEKAATLLWDKTSQVFRLQAAHGWEPQELAGFSLTPEEVAARYTSHGEELAPNIHLVRDPSGHAVPEEALPHGPMAQAILVIRIRTEEQVDGYLILENFSHVEDFVTPQGIDLLEKLLDHIVMAFRKAKMLVELAEQREAAQRANILKSQFLANMSHEIRTPMNAILGFTRLLHDNETDDEKREQLAIVSEAGENLINLINDILDFSKIEADRIEIVPVVFSLKKMVEHLELLYRHKAQHKGIGFSVHLTGRVPPRVRGDSFRLNQVVVNVVSNALKFTRQGGVTVGCDYVDGVVALDIQDTGIGIAREKQQLVFQPFVQADGSTSREYGGTGLGLAICQRIVTLLGGTITLRSEQGVGSLFQIRVPMPEEAGADGALTPSAHAGKPGPVGAMVAIVADQASDFKPLEEILTRHGFHAREIDSQAGVADAVAALGVDVVLLDLAMADRDGWRVNDLLKRDVRTAHLPVIVVSGQNQPQNLLLYGVFDYVHKPVREEELVLRLDAALQFLGQSRNVFIIDDDEGMLALYRAHLRRHRFVSFAFTGAREALDQIVDGVRPDLIILDLMMPQMDGFEFLDTLRRQYHLKIPVFIVTGKELTIEETRRLRQDAQQVFSKSRSSMDDFVAFLNGFLERRRQRGEAMLAGWEAQLDDPSLAPLLAEALGKMPQWIRDLEAAIGAEDRAQVEAVSHSVKGVCLNLHMAELAELAGAIDEEARQPGWNLDRVKGLCSEIRGVMGDLAGLGGPRAGERSAVSPPVSKPSILVAEDEAINRKLMQVFLQRLDFTCDFAVNGREALTKMRLKRYDIVFLDIQMPEMSGLEVLEVVRRDRDLAGTVVVALTANAIKGDSEKYIVAGCDDYLAKPVSLEMLGEKIAYWRQRAGRRGKES